MDVCDSGHTFPFLKQLTFYRKEAFDLNAYYANGDSETLIGRVYIQFLTHDSYSLEKSLKIDVCVEKYLH